MYDIITTSVAPIVIVWDDFNDFLKQKKSEAIKLKESRKAGSVKYNTIAQTIKTRLEPKPIVCRPVTWEPPKEVRFSPKRKLLPD